MDYVLMSSIAPSLGALPQPYLNQTTPAAQTQPATAQLTAHFEKAVYASDAAALKNLAQKTPDLLAKPFSNGDLPLAAAVKGKQAGSVKALLELGASPTQRDDQLLSAMDYALLMQDQQQIAEILHHFISEDLSSIQTLLQNPYVLNQAKTGLAEIQKTQTELSKANATYYPVAFKAVMQKDKALLASILAQPNINVAERTATSQSLLHIAIAAGDAEILDQCLAHPSAQELINLPTNTGKTPLHFAAALGRLDMMRSLSTKGANLRQADHNQITPLALLAVSAEHKDPLKVSKKDLFIFLSAAAIWSAQFIPVKGMSRQNYFGVVIALASLGGIAGIMNHLRSFKTWKGYFAYQLTIMALSGAFRNSPQMLLALSVFQVGRYAKNAFDGLRFCWRNAALGKGKALYKAVVTYGPTANLVINGTSVLWSAYKSPTGDTPAIILDPVTQRLLDFYQRIHLCDGSDTHLQQCLDKSWNITQLCDADPFSEECKNAGDQFMNFVKRKDLYNNIGHDAFFHCKDNETPEKCFNASEEYILHCRPNLDSQECMEAESVFKKILKLDLQSASAEACEQARNLIGCALTDTVEKCKELFTEKVKQVHPDINPGSAQPTDTSELVKAMRTIKECAKEKDA
jgi:ankyrin repeat protein